jgi:hypothetical protein
MGPSLLVSEPAGVVSGVFFGAVVFFIARACGLDHTWATVLACIFHFVANTLIAGHINLALVGGVANGAVKVSPSDSGSPSCRRGKRFGAILSRRDPSVASGALRSHKGVSSAMARERLRPARTWQWRRSRRLPLWRRGDLCPRRCRYQWRHLWHPKACGIQKLMED